MKTRRSFRPSLQSLEGRVVLSFSFSRVIHSVFPFIKDTTKSKPTPAALQLAAARKASAHPVASHVARAIPTQDAAPAVAGHAHAHPQGLPTRVYHARVR